MPVAAVIPRSKPAPSFVRMAYAKASGGLRGTSGEDILASRWPQDGAARHLIRGNPGTANTGDEAWAGLLAKDAFAQFLTDLAPASAAAGLIARGLRLPLSGANTVMVPARSAPPVAPAWVAESGAIPLVRRPLAGVQLGPPRKLASLVVWSWELDRTSAARTIFEQMLRQDVAVGLDLAYFSTEPGSAAAHKGLLNGITPIAAATGGAPEAVQADIAAVVGAVTGPGSSGEAVVVTSNTNAALARVYLPETTAQLSILGSPALTDEVIGIDPKSIVHGGDDDPDVDITDKPMLHMEDTAPAALGVPSISLFQEAKIALRIMHAVSFVKLRSDCVAWVDGSSWAAP